jgi:hypothetical protein
MYYHVLVYLFTGKLMKSKVAQVLLRSINVPSLSEDEMSVLLRKGREDLSDAELEVLWDDMNHDGDEAARARRAQRAQRPHHCSYRELLIGRNATVLTENTGPHSVTMCNACHPADVA